MLKGFIRFPEITEFNESSVPFGKNSVELQCIPKYDNQQISKLVTFCGYKWTVRSGNLILFITF